MSKPRVVVWFSCGAASAVAAKLTPDAVMVYCETNSEHHDNKRFMKDIERWCERKVFKLKNQKYKDTWDVWIKERYLAGINGAPCTTLLKARPRLEFQRPDDIQVLGYTADKTDRNRAKRLQANYPEINFKFPLIESGLTKENCLSLIERAGIKIPILYGLGFTNNNCIPCVKAQSASYWALVRKEFPEQFARMAKLCHELGVTLAQIKGNRIFIDDIPLDWPTANPIVPTCDFLCSAAELEYNDDD